MNVAVAVIAIVVFLTALGLTLYFTLRRRNLTEQAYIATFSNIKCGDAWAKVRWEGVTTPSDQALKQFCAILQHATDCMDGRPWPVQDINYHITSHIMFVIMPVAKWTDAWGRTVAGLAFTNGTIQLGCDYAALPHEIGEVIYTALTEKEDWQAEQWDGRAKLEQAITLFGLGNPLTIV